MALKIELRIEYHAKDFMLRFDSNFGPFKNTGRWIIASFLQEKITCMACKLYLPLVYQDLEYNIQVLTIEMTGRKPSCIRVQITAVTSTIYFMLVLCVLYSKTLKR